MKESAGLLIGEGISLGIIYFVLGWNIIIPFCIVTPFLLGVVLLDE